MNDVERLLKECLETRSPILFLGAGFSINAQSGAGIPLMLGNNLGKALYNNVIEPEKGKLDIEPNEKRELDYCIENGKLLEICNYISLFELKAKRNKYFQKAMSNCTWDDKYKYFQYLTSYKWDYIFTLNIDDLVEKIYNSTDETYVKWTRESVHYEHPIGKTLLIKLHGDINGNPNLFVFDKDEYNQYIAENSWMIETLTDLSMRHDVIFIGTQLQEDDVAIAFQQAFQKKCINTNYHYFFLSPNKLERKLRNKIESNDNMHFVQWDTEKFLKFLKFNISKNTETESSLRSNGFSLWNEELKQCHGNSDMTELYYGELAEPKDYYFQFDIPRRREKDIEMSFIRTCENGIIAIHGDAYVGKTCFAKRLLTDFAQDGYNTYYCSSTECRTISLFDAFLDCIDREDKIAVCFENSADQYYLLVRLLQKCISKRASLYIITTANEINHRIKEHNLMKVPSTQIYLKEKVSKTFAKDIYQTLEAHSYLNKLVGFGPSHAIQKEMCQINDFIDVLYIAHDGRGFTLYFTDWLQNINNSIYMELFEALTLLASVGINNYKVSFLPTIATAVSAFDFKYTDFKRDFGKVCLEDGDRLYLRCVRLFQDIVLQKLAKSKKIKLVNTLAKDLGMRIVEREYSSNNDMFEHLISAKNLIRIMGFTNAESLDILCDLKPTCKHLSFYWIQLGILYRDQTQFEDAGNSFAYAEKARNYLTYQIAHAKAKNEMEWGVWCVANEPSEASRHFEQGVQQMLKLLIENKYSNAYSFSAHTYVDMNLSYYTELNKVPTDERWKFMCTCISGYLTIELTKNNMTEALLNKMISFSENMHLKFDIIYYRNILDTKPECDIVNTWDIDSLAGVCE